VGSEQFLKACGSRRKRQCPSCAGVYRGDVLALLREGLTVEPKHDNVVSFLTLTAPGAAVFGETHSRRMKRRKNGSMYHWGCPCGAFHDDDDPLLGTPLDPDTYDYETAAWYNATASRRLAVTLQKLSRLTYGGTSDPDRRLVSVRVAEFQARGLVHFHVLVLGRVKSDTFFTAVRGGINSRTGRRISPASHAGMEWGYECDIRYVTPGSKFGIGYYMAKLANYAVKDADWAPGDATDEGSVEPRKTEILQRRSHNRKMDDAALSSGTCSEKTPCQRSIPGSRPARACRGHRLAVNGWGFRGHVFSASRTWGITMGSIRARRAHHLDQDETTYPEDGANEVFNMWTVTYLILDYYP